MVELVAGGFLQPHVERFQQARQAELLEGRCEGSVHRHGLLCIRVLTEQRRGEGGWGFGGRNLGVLLVPSPVPCQDASIHRAMSHGAVVGQVANERMFAEEVDCCWGACRFTNSRIVRRR